MPYEYRRMTLEECAAVLRQRQEHGYPLHSPPHPFRESGQYLLTATNFEHVPIMAAPDRSTDFESRLITAMSSINAEVFGWVILPNHYHILVGVEFLDWVSAVLQQLHGATSRQWNLADHQTGKRRVWYKFSDRVIRNDVNFYRALNYIHFNPVKHGYLDDPYEWPWSSVHNYVEAYGREWLREK